MALVCLTPVNPAFADDVVEFVPTVRVLGTRTWNIQRDPGTASSADDSLWYQLVLPLEIRGPRWTTNIAYTPAYRQQLDGLVDNQLDHSLRARVSGGWSPRTDLAIGGRLRVTPEIFGLPLGDVAVPRTNLINADVDAALRHKLTARDSLSLSLAASLEDFTDETFVDTGTFRAGVAYGRRLSRRLELVAGVGGQLFSFSALGGDVRSIEPSAGLRYDWGRSTTAEVRVGASLLRGDLSSGETTASLDETAVTAIGRLDHSMRDFALGVEVERGFGGGGGLGQPFERTRLSGSLAYTRLRWEAAVSLGAARNERVLDNAVAAALFGALLPEEFRDVARLDTITSSGRLDFWLSRRISIRGDYDLVFQDSPQAAAFDFDSYRVSLGLAWRVWNAPPVRGVGP